MTELEMDFREVTRTRIESQPPWYFRLARALARRHIRGGTRLLEEARRRGLLDMLVEYPLADDVRLRVPIWRPCNSWDHDDVLGYEAAFLRLFTGCVGSLGRYTTLVDCGADIGTVSAHVRARCSNVSRIVAYEPNPSAHRILKANLDALPIPADARNAAVSNFSGRGRLASPPSDQSAHAMFLVPSRGGDIVVERVDQLRIPPDRPLALKIDVEGGELLVVDGAADTIAAAARVAIAFEAHPTVSQRTGQDPMCVMRRLRELRRDLVFLIDTVPARTIDSDRPVFEQVEPNRVYNIVAVSSSL
jgi:FkbM family methyltransferase